MIPEQQILDKFTRQDEIQAMMIPLLEEIRDKPVNVDVTIPPGADLAELIDLLKFQQAIDFKPFTLTYPRDGTRLTIAAGTTTFDFLAGTVAAPGESIADMGNSLMLQRKEFMRALSINADHDTVVRIGSADKMPIRAGSFPIFPYRQFTTVEITVTEATEILISASTSSAAIIQMGGETSPSTHEFTGDVYEGEQDMSDAGWDVSEAHYVQSFSVAAQEISTRGIFFKPDGIKMYIVGVTGQDVNEYDLSTAWDVSTAVYLQNFDVSARESAPEAIFFKSDGLKMYIAGSNGDEVNEYNLGTAWDVSTAVWLQLFSVAAQGNSPTGLSFNSTGSKMYVLNQLEVDEYDLGAAWDVTSAVYLQNFSVATQTTLPQGVFFKSDGLKMYITAYSEGDVHEYDLSTAWDVTSAVWLQKFTGETQLMLDAFFSPDGAKMYSVRFDGDIQQYSTAHRFSESKLLLRDVIIRTSTHDAVLGDATRQRYPKAAGSACGFTKVDLSKLYFANANPSNNTKINILGVRL